MEMNVARQNWSHKNFNAELRPNFLTKKDTFLF